MKEHKKTTPVPLMIRVPLWLKRNLFQTPLNSVISIFLLAALVKVVEPIWNWLVVDSVWMGDASACREAQGACLAFIREKFKYILFGMYPEDELWRPITAIILFLALIFYSRRPKRWNKRLAWRWFKFFLLGTLLMRGGFFGFTYVDSSKWGGLPLTLMLATIGLIFSYPIGILLALGRRSKMPFIKSLCVAYIELIRGVPLISLLFMSSVMFPLFLPEGINIDKLLRAQVAIIMFISAYMAEVVRGGLQAIPKGQYEAAWALGLNYYQTMRLIILPQALKIVIPPTVNTAIGMFKDTSLVVIIALFDLMYTTKSALTDVRWLGFSIEAYLFVGLIYFSFCFLMGRYSKHLEKILGQENQEIV